MYFHIKIFSLTLEDVKISMMLSKNNDEILHYIFTIPCTYLSYKQY